MDKQQWTAAAVVFHNREWPEEVPEFIRRWAQARGYSHYQDFEKFFDFKLKDLADPLTLKDMDKAVERLVLALQRQEKICIYADYDMDGTPGLALLLKGLRRCGFQHLTYFQPNRFVHGYGVHPEIIEDFITERDVRLFVTVDVGITDVVGVQRAYEMGVDFIITDHHQPKEVLPPAVAIVNPNQSDCPSGLHYLCGTGVAFYLVLGLRRRLKELQMLATDFDPKELLDCFAIGTLTDMVPIVNENRALVQHGLRVLQRTPSKGLRALMEELKLTGTSLSSQDVAIRLSPKLNALGRMNTDLSAIEVFLVDDEDQAFRFVKEVIAANQQRVDVQKQGEQLIDELMAQAHNHNHAFVFSEHFHKGVVGLLATKILERYHLPTLVGTIEDGRIVGSARAPEGSNILAALEACAASLSKYGGHHRAAGFELPLENAEGFAQSLRQHFAPIDKPEKSIRYDMECNLTQLDATTLEWIRRLEPLGMGFEAPILLLKDLFVASCKTLKEIHLKLVLKDIEGRSIEALWFNVEDIVAKKKLTGQRVRIVGELSRNQFMGKESLQILIRELQIDGH